MAAVPEEAERLEGQVAIEQQVGDEHHQAAAAELADHPPERGLRRGAVAGLERAQRLEELVPVAEARPRRGDRADVVIEGDEAGGVALPEQHQRQRRDQALGVGQLGQDALGRRRSRPCERLASHTTMARRLVSSSNCFTYSRSLRPRIFQST